MKELIGIKLGVGGILISYFGSPIDARHIFGNDFIYSYDNENFIDYGKK